MHEVGFEPTSIATPHLECGPLDRSGIRARLLYLNPYPFYYTLYKLYSMTITFFNLLNILIRFFYSTEMNFV